MSTPLMQSSSMQSQESDSDAAPTLTTLSRVVIDRTSRVTSPHDPTNQSDQLSTTSGLPRVNTMSKASALPAVATAKFMRTKSVRKAARDMADLEAEVPGACSPEPEEVFVVMDPWIIHPMDYRYQVWLWIATLAAVVTAWLSPYTIAFVEGNGLRDWTSATTLIDLLLIIIFAIDLTLHFFVAYIDHEALVTDRELIARRYIKGKFWADLVGCIPFDWIIYAAAGLINSNSITARWLGLIKVLRVIRIYRLADLIAMLERMPKVSYFYVTIFRDFMYVFLTVHWAACALYFVASLYNFSDDTFVGVNMAWIGTKGLFARYIYSFYWAIVTFATVGYGDLHPYTVGETVVTCVFVMINIAMTSYIIASVTMLVSKNDQRVAEYRDRMAALFTYSTVHDLPDDLRDRMHDHLRLHQSNKDSNDEAILQYYPTAIRRRVLRQLYLQPLQYCALFFNCSPKFLDAVMAISRVELYMPQVDILSDSDHVHELYIIVAGECEVQATRATGSTDPEGLVLDATMGSVHGAKRAVIGEGDTFGELAFFTGIVSPEVVRTRTVCRVLVVPKEAYSRLALDFPLATQHVLDNLLNRAREAARVEFRYCQDARVLELTSVDGAHDVSSPQYADIINQPGWSEVQRNSLRSLLQVRALLREHAARAKELRTNELLNAATRGDVQHMKRLLESGVSPNQSDYDGRTALMLGAAKGHYDVTKMLLLMGADPERRDHLGSSAVLEACRAGHDEVLEALLAAGGRLCINGMALASVMCEAVSGGNAPYLTRLLKAGADPNSADYDLRTPLHIAASDSNLAFVKLLIEKGSADPLVTDRWGATPLDEARRVGGASVVEYLVGVVTPEQAEASLRRFEENRTESLLRAAAAGGVADVHEALRKGCPVDAADYDLRTALMVACASGHQAVVEALLAAGANPLRQDNFGGSALMEACKRGDRSLIDLLLQHKARLLLAGDEIAPKLCAAVLKGDLQQLRLFLVAGADPNVGDYDARTPLHVAAAEGSLEAVRLLVEEGKANVGVVDRWGHTPLDEARRVGAQEVAAFLQDKLPKPFTQEDE